MLAQTFFDIVCNTGVGPCFSLIKKNINVIDHVICWRIRLVKIVL